MKNIKIFAFVLILLIVPVFAEQSISQTSFVINVYNNTIQITSNEYEGNNQNFTFTISNRNDTIASGNSTINVSVNYVPYTNFNYSFLFVRNISVDMSLVDKYTNCLNDTTICKLDAASNFTQYSVSTTNLNNQITTQKTQIDTLTKDKTDTQNQKWLYLIAGAVIAVLITLASQGKIRRKPKDASGEFNRSQAR